MVPFSRSSRVSPAALAIGTSHVSTCMMAVRKRCPRGYFHALCREKLDNGSRTPFYTAQCVDPSVIKSANAGGVRSDLTEQFIR